VVFHSAALEGEGDNAESVQTDQGSGRWPDARLTCTAINPDVMRSPCHINYLVQVEGVAAFAGDSVFELWCMQWSNPGDNLPVAFDRARNDHIRIPTHAESAPRHDEHPAAGR
jgi:hypothetical protein